MDLESQIHSWPVRDHLIASQFGDSTHNIYESAPLGKGIWALERLLYSHNMNEKSTCELYKAQLSEIHRLLNIYHRLWNDQYSQELQIAQGSLWMNPQDVIDDLTLASISVLEIVHKSKLDKPIRGNGIAAWPESLQAWRSQTSFELIQANLKSLEKIWDHHNPLWKIIEDGLEGQIHDQFDHIHQLEKELSTQSLYLELLDNQRQNYEEYINSVYTLLVLFSVDLSSQLGVVNVLSDNDGD
jgi:predicted lipoprotein